MSRVGLKLRSVYNCSSFYLAGLSEQRGKEKANEQISFHEVVGRLSSGELKEWFWPEFSMDWCAALGSSKR